jgi:hypothetical protein
MVAIFLELQFLTNAQMDLVFLIKQNAHTQMVAIPLILFDVPLKAVVLLISLPRALLALPGVSLVSMVAVWHRHRCVRELTVAQCLHRIDALTVSARHIQLRSTRQTLALLWLCVPVVKFFVLMGPVSHQVDCVFQHHPVKLVRKFAQKIGNVEPELIVKAIM